MGVPKAIPLILSVALILLAPAIIEGKMSRQVGDLIIEVEKPGFSFFNTQAIIGPTEAKQGERVAYRITGHSGVWLNEQDVVIRTDQNLYTRAVTGLELAVKKNGNIVGGFSIPVGQLTLNDGGRGFRIDVTITAPNSVGDYKIDVVNACSGQFTCGQNIQPLKIVSSQCSDQNRESFYKDITGGEVFKEDTYIGTSPNCNYRLYMRTECDSNYHVETFDDESQIARRLVSNADTYYKCELDSQGGGAGGSGGGGSSSGGGQACTAVNNNPPDIQITNVVLPETGKLGEQFKVGVNVKRMNEDWHSSGEVNMEVAIYSIEAAQRQGLISGDMQSIFFKNIKTSCANENFVQAKKASSGILTGPTDPTSASVIFTPLFPSKDSKLASDGLSNYNADGKYVVVAGIYQECGKDYFNDACSNEEGKTFILKRITLSKAGNVLIEGEGTEGEIETELCKKENEIFYTNGNLFVEAQAFPLFREVESGEILNPKELDTKIPGFSSKYKEGIDGACCSSLSPEFQASRTNEFGPDIFFLVGKRFTRVSYDSYICKPKSEAGLCIASFHKTLKDTTKGNCTTNTAIGGIGILLGLFIFLKIFGGYYIRRRVEI